jgi:hypothetical protein
MIDFQNSVFSRLNAVQNHVFSAILAPILVREEEIIASFQGIRDGVVFTNLRIISINIQGLTGKKKDLTSMPYSKIQVFSVETAGTLDADSELEVWFSGVGKVKFEFTRNTNINAIGRIISEQVL